MTKRFFTKRMISISMALLMVVSLLMPLSGTTRAAAEEDVVDTSTKGVIVGDTVDPDKLTGTDWMSMISNERYLNEINIPGAHDAAMAIYSSNGVAGNFYPSYAKTQNKSIRDQLNFGVRLFDIRMTNKKDLALSGNDTYIVHGQKTNDFVDLRYYSRKSSSFFDDSNYKLSDLMSDTTEFLKNNPTETILLELGYEYEAGDENETYSKAKGLLDTYVGKINPTTGKPYIYTQDGNKTITSMPKMGDVRGQIVILSKNASSLGYGIQFSAPNGYSKKTVAGVPFTGENHYEADASHKLDYVKAFFNGGTIKQWPSSGTKAYPDDKSDANAIDLSKDVLHHMNQGNVVYTSSNVAWADWQKLGDNPVQIANKVNPWLYGDAGYFNTRGKLYGWVYSDFVDWNIARKVYMANFPTGSDGLAYKKVTYVVDPENASANRTYMVLAGETITVETCDDLNNDGSTFIGWKNSDGLVKPGEKKQITDDTTFTAEYKVTWKDLQNYVKKLSDQGKKSGEIKLTSDITVTAVDETIVIPEGISLTLDLNGHTINAVNPKNDYSFYRNFFSVYGSMNVINSDKTTAKLTNAVGRDGGAFFVAAGGSLSLGSAIEVSGNSSSLGGAIYLSGAEGSNTKNAAKNGATLTLSGTKISGNTSYGSNTGGIFCGKGATIEIKDDTVVADNRRSVSGMN
ncbi:MAG: hypothetical protein K5644_00025, partial [Lachnospiraceae bacterium]|nr:hypothetical protein [Lachnospiraceae bacterium]